MAEYIGRFHPAAVHFPIALIIVALLFELYTLARRQPLPTPAAHFMLGIGWLVGLAALVTGWANADNNRHPDMEQVVELHRWLSIAAIGLALLAWGAAMLVARRRVPVAVYLVPLVLAAGLVAYSAHLGGSLVYGEGWLRWQAAEEEIE